MPNQQTPTLRAREGSASKLDLPDITELSGDDQIQESNIAGGKDTGMESTNLEEEASKNARTSSADSDSSLTEIEEDYFQDLERLTISPRVAHTQVGRSTASVVAERQRVARFTRSYQVSNSDSEEESSLPIDSENNDFEPELVDQSTKVPRKASLEPTSAFVRWNPRRAAVTKTLEMQSTQAKNMWRSAKKIATVKPRKAKGSKSSRRNTRRALLDADNYDPSEFDTEVMPGIFDDLGNLNPDATTAAPSSSTAGNFPTCDPRDYAEQPELTREQRGTAHLPPLPDVLPLIWTPRPDPTKNIPCNDVLEGIPPKFAIGQQVLMILHENEQDSADRIIKNRKGEVIGREPNFQTRVWTIESRTARPVPHEPGDDLSLPEKLVLFYVVKPPPGRSSNKITCGEDYIVATKHLLGEEVDYMIGLPGDTPRERRPALVIGAYVRKRKRMYCLRDMGKPAEVTEWLAEKEWMDVPDEWVFPRE